MIYEYLSASKHPRQPSCVCQQPNCECRSWIDDDALDDDDTSKIITEESGSSTESSTNYEATFDASLEELRSNSTVSEMDLDIR